MSEIKDEIAEVKTVSLAEIMKQELEKSLDNMANEISTVKTNLHETKEEVDEQRDKEKRRNNIIIYNIPESLGERADGRIKTTYHSVSGCSIMCCKQVCQTKTCCMCSV